MEPSQGELFPERRQGTVEKLLQKVAQLFRPETNAPGQALSPQRVHPFEQNLAAKTERPVELLLGWGVPVVGESFYEQSFKKLHHRLTQDPSGEFLEWAEIATAPENPYSKSGKAVAVFVEGLQVGHVSELLAPIVFDALHFLGGKARVRAQVYLDTTSGNYRWSSVSLRLALPPTMAVDAADYKVQTVRYGPRHESIGLFIASDKAGSLISHLAAGEALIAQVNLKVKEGKLQICTVDGVSFLDPIEMSILEDHPFLQAPMLAYVTAKIRKTDKGFQVGVQATNDLKILKERTGNAVSAAGNVLSSKFQLGLTPSGNWIKIRKSPKNSSGSGLQVPPEFEANQYQPAVYFWSRVDPRHGDFWTPWGFSGAFYQNTKDRYRKQLESVGFFLMLIRSKYDSETRKVSYEADFDLEAGFVLLPERPLEPMNALRGTKPIVQNSAPRPRKSHVESPVPQPTFTSGAQRSQLLSGKLRTTGFDYLESTYLIPCLQGLFDANFDATSENSVLIGGSFFDINESSSAKEAVRRGSLILDTGGARALLAEDLKKFPKYQALTRYEEWFRNLGVSSFGGWGFQLEAFEFERSDIALIPGAALDERPMFKSISFSADLVSVSQSKEELSALFESLGGTVLDSVVVRAKLRYSVGKSGLVAEAFIGQVFVGRTPANPYESLADSAKLYGLEEVWVRIDWTSNSRFRGAFSLDWR